MKYILFILLTINGFWANAQKQGQALIDSLEQVLPSMKADSFKVKALNNLSYEYRRIDVDEGIRYGTMAIALAEKLNWKTGLGQAYWMIGINYSGIAVLDTAMENLDKALEIFTAIKDDNGIAKVYGTMGNVYNIQGNGPKALEFHLKALSINEDLKEERAIAGNLNNIAVIYFEIGRTAEAIELLERAVTINTKINNKAFLAINYHELGRFSESLKDYDKAFEYSNKAYTVSKEIGDKVGMALGLEGMGFVYESKKEYNQALLIYMQVLQIRKEFEDKLGVTGAFGSIAICYLSMAKENGPNKKTFLDSAGFYASKGIDAAKEIGNFEWQRINYNSLSETQQLQGNFSNALESYKLSIAFQDSVLNSEKKETIKNLEDKRAIEVRDKQLKINELEIDNRKKLQWLFITGIGFLALIGALLYWQSNSRKKINQQLQLLNTELVEANETKARFVGILNHDLRSPVANLIQFLNIQKNAPDLLDDESKNRMEQQTMTSAENLLQSMEDILIWSKGQMQHFKPVIKPTPVSRLFENISNHFYSTQHVKFTFENNQNISLNTDENFLLTIMRNLTGNAAKALEQTADASITWQATQIHGKSILTITDNGPGIETGEFKALFNEKEIAGIKSGLGLHLIRDMAKAIDCTIDIKSEKGKGTIFTLYFNA